MAIRMREIETERSDNKFEYGLYENYKMCQSMVYNMNMNLLCLMPF